MATKKTTDKSRGQKIRGCFTRLLTYADDYNNWLRTHRSLLDGLKEQADRVPEERGFDVDLAAGRIRLEGEAEPFEYGPRLDFLIVLAILDHRRVHGPRIPMSVAGLLAAFTQLHEELTGVCRIISESTLRRIIAALRVASPAIGACVAPGCGRGGTVSLDTSIPAANPSGLPSTAQPLNLAAVQDLDDLLEQLVEQVWRLPHERWLLVDLRANLVFLEGSPTPFRFVEEQEIPLACEVLNARRLRGEVRPTPAQQLVMEMKNTYWRVFGEERLFSYRTLARRLEVFRGRGDSEAALAECLIPTLNRNGGLSLYTRRTDNLAEVPPVTAWPIFPPPRA